MIRSMRPSRSASTWSARVGESRFARFALGAAIGWPVRAIRPSATLPAGARTATVSLPAVTTSGMMPDRLRTSVRGPGQKRRGQSLGGRGPLRDAFAGLRSARHMNDHGVDRGPFLGREDPRDRLRVGGDCSQTVNRLGRERDQPASSQYLRRRVECGRVRLVGVHDDDTSGALSDTCDPLGPEDIAGASFSEPLRAWSSPAWPPSSLVSYSARSAS